MKSYSDLATADLATVIDAVVDGNPERYGIMRIDLCSAMAGVPVLWFLPRARVKFKRQPNKERSGWAGFELPHCSALPSPLADVFVRTGYAAPQSD